MMLMASHRRLPFFFFFYSGYNYTVLFRMELQNYKYTLFFAWDFSVIAINEILIITVQLLLDQNKKTNNLQIINGNMNAR